MSYSFSQAELNKQKPKVLVALSGGVDSSVAAGLLKRAGFVVEAVHFRFFDGNQEAEKRARRTAKKLGIGFRVFDLRDEFKKRVIDYFLNEYKVGRTPNPCVLCNKEVKFKFLLQKAKELGCDYAATGHYARIKKLKTQNSKLKSTGQKLKFFKLLRAKDKNKDQSYFLWRLGKKELSKIIFPIGDYTKPEVRQMAKKFGLPIANAKESQEVCFLKNTNLREFLQSRIKTKKGKVVDCNGKILGEHQGLCFYTIGQRKGIGLSGGAYYVVSKDIKNNILIISKNKNDLLKKWLAAENVNWISCKEPQLPLRVKAKIRHRAGLAQAVIIKDVAYNVKHKAYKVTFARAQGAVTPGQSVVFYKGNELLGGGIII